MWAGSPVSGLIEQHETARALESRTREQAVATLQSPQFRRTLDVFSAALVSGRLDLRHFGLDPQVGSLSSPFHPAAQHYVSWSSNGPLMLRSAQLLVTSLRGEPTKAVTTYEGNHSDCGPRFETQHGDAGSS